MFGRLARALQRRRETRALQRHPIPDALWQSTLERYPFLAQADERQLLRLCSLFLAEKEFHGAAGFEVSDDVALAVAAQACLPILKLGLQAYDSFVGIVIHKGEVRAARTLMDEDGVVHEFDEELAGETMAGGPLMLAWSAVTHPIHDASGGVFNVVIHEFAHVLEQRLLPSSAIDVIEPVWKRFCRRIERGGSSVIDAYGAENVNEFFAVASEAFFIAPEALKKEQPALYRLLNGFYNPAD